MMKQLLTALLVAAALAVLPPVGAEEGEPQAPPQAPTLNGSYNPDTQGLTLTWQPDPAWPAGVVYKVYRNGQEFLQTAGNSTTRDLGLWLEGVREYTLTVTLPGLPESDGSLPFRVVKNVMVPSSCQVASVSIYTRPPGASYTVYDECLPE